MGEKEAMEMNAVLESKGEVDFHVCTLNQSENVIIKANMLTISKKKIKEHHRVFTPSVIEPSFGIGRIIHCLCEHSFYTRPSEDGDEQLNIFRFPPLIAPIKCTVFPLVQKQQYEEVAKCTAESLTAARILHIIDMTGRSIGRKYARTDELGVPLAITVNSTTSVTVRERDSKARIRVSVEEASYLVKDMIEGMSWNDILLKYSPHWSRLVRSLLKGFRIRSLYFHLMMYCLFIMLLLYKTDASA